MERSPLAEYEVRRAQRPPKYMPTEEDLAKLLAAVPRYYDPRENPNARDLSAGKRLFHRTHNRAILSLLVDTPAGSARPWASLSRTSRRPSGR